MSGVDAVREELNLETELGSIQIDLTQIPFKATQRLLPHPDE
jgi:hypothetical protein